MSSAGPVTIPGSERELIACHERFAATPPKGHLEKAPVTFGEYTRVIEPIVQFGYLTVTVDASKLPAGLSIAFRWCDGSEMHDEYNGSL